MAALRATAWNSQEHQLVAEKVHEGNKSLDEKQHEIKVTTKIIQLPTFCKAQALMTSK